MRLIDADALKRQIESPYTEYPIMIQIRKALKDFIDDAPSIDIVRCKECRHSFINENHPQKPRICGLTKKCGTTKDDWYCADGEREGE